MAFRIAGLGEVLWDAFPEGEKFGGAPANFTCHCHSLGAHAHVISCVGDDARGAGARAFLENHGVGVSGLATSKACETGVVIVTLDAEGKPDYEIKEGVAWDRIPFTAAMASVCAEADAVCFGSLCQRYTVSRATIRRCLAATKPKCLRVFDINLRQAFYGHEVIFSSLQAANVLKLNDEELSVVAEMLDISGSNETQLKVLVEAYCLELAILTCGEKGALMVTPTGSSFVAPVATDVVSTVGAGDAFTAATVVGFLEGRSLEDINRHANRVAAFVCTRQGAVPPLPESLVTCTEETK